MNSCAGADNTAAPEYLEEVRKYIKAHPGDYPGRKFVDQHGKSDGCCCLLEDFVGTTRCPGDACYFHGPDGKKIQNYTQHKDLDTPIIK
jgi:hypothetical protein